MIAMVMTMIVKKKEEELTGEAIGMAAADVETIGTAIVTVIGKAIGTAIGKEIMKIVAANLKRSGRSTGDRDLPPDNKGARKHLSTTLTGMYV